MDAQQMINQATDLRNAGKGHDAAKLYQQVKDQALANNDIGLAAEMEHMSGVSYNIEDDQKNARKHYELAKDLYKQAGSAIGLGRVLRDEAISYVYESELETASRLIEESVAELKMADMQLRNRFAKAELGVSVIKNGHILDLLGKPLEAVSMIEQGNQIVQEAGQDFYLATGLLNLAQARVSLADYATAYNLLEQAEQKFTASGQEQSRRLAQVYGLQGYCLLGLDMASNKEPAQALINRVDELLKDISKSARKKVHQDVHYDQIKQALKK